MNACLNCRSTTKACAKCGALDGMMEPRGSIDIRSVILTIEHLHERAINIHGFDCNADNCKSTRTLRILEALLRS